MSTLISFRFLDPAWLLLLPVAWYLVWMLRRFYLRQSMWQKFCDPNLLAYMIRDQPDSQAPRWHLLLLVLVLSLGIVALAGPSCREQSNPLLESASARVLVLDLSQSMLVEDVKPNRFTQALAQARQILSTEFAGETGLVVYAGAAFVVSPLSRDAGTLLAFLDALSPETMPVVGARLDQAITSAQELLTASIARRGQILVISAGSGDMELAVQAAGDASELGNRVSVIAIGSKAGGPIRDSEGGLSRDAKGKVILAKTDFVALERIAQTGNGLFVQYLDALDTNSLLSFDLDPDLVSQPLASLASLEESLKTPANDGIWFVWLLLPFALLFFRKNAFWIVLLAVSFPSDRQLYAMDFQSLWKHQNKQAFEAYQQGDYQRAITLTDDPMIRGAAYYRLNEFNEAATEFELPDTAEAWFNRGNALARSELFTEALAAYKRALEYKSNLEHAEHNLRLIEAFLSERQQAGNSVGDSEEDSNTDAEELESADARSRAGSSGERSENPADSQQPGLGSGSSVQPGDIDLDEEYQGNDPELERLMLQEFSGEALPEAALIDRWIESLPQASSDLFQRKFLRDYNRKRNQAR